MKKDLFYENRKRLIFAAITLVAMLALCLCAAGLVKMQTEHNDSKTEKALTGISYTEDAAESELAALKPYTEYYNLSVEQRGQLYRAMAELSYMTGDDMEYNNYIAHALFYLQSAGDIDSVVYLSNKYIGRLYANGCYSSAEEILQNMARDNDISLLTLEMQASYYLSCADVAQMQGKDASGDLSNAKAAIQLMAQCESKLLNQAKYDLLSARDEIRNNEFEKAEARMAGYSVDDNFGLGEKQVYVICDFQIPYYEIMAKIELHNGETELAYKNIDEYLRLCDDFQFRTMKLHLLQYVVANAPNHAEGTADRYAELEKTVMSQNLNEMTEEYGQFLVGDIANTQESLLASEQKKVSDRRGWILGAVFLYVAVLLYCAVSIFIDYMSKDGLTHLNGRKQYESIRQICEKKKIPYCFLMIDIDDFKKVNDTYGHDKGDDVLREISGILRRYTGRGISAYRYGGEELCLFFLRVPEERARQISEEIRIIIEQTVRVGDSHITISGGIGVSKNGENVFQQADCQLYESKRNGKNQIR